MKSFLVALAFVAMGNASHAQSAEQKNSPTSVPKVEIVSQPESPLQILSVQTKSRPGNGSLIEVSITVENYSPKPISAYATRDPNDDGNRCFVLSANSPGKALRQAQSEVRTTWQSDNPSAQMRRLVDFVEFTDGTTWGTDTCQTAEYLASRRAGAREARKLLLEIFEAAGADAVLSRLKAGVTPVDPPANQSPKWKQGFRSGFESFVERVNQANQEWGYTEIESALRRPIDALAEK
jgi:hypothetical protein